MGDFSSPRHDLVRSNHIALGSNEMRSHEARSDDERDINAPLREWLERAGLGMAE